MFSDITDRGNFLLVLIDSHRVSSVPITYVDLSGPTTISNADKDMTGRFP